jgi:lipoprotein-anchoring transpeptidase ErfK/SrfK
MRCVIVAAAAAAAFGLSLLASTGPASADVLISIDKSRQRMAVLVDGRIRHSWAVSTGLGGGPPNGGYRPERLERQWHSRKYNWAPMPHAIFFHKGYAIHGTMHVSRLGRRASHGCVRLHPAHAATLFALVRSHGLGRTRIQVGHVDARMQGLPPRARLLHRLAAERVFEAPRARARR